MQQFVPERVAFSIVVLHPSEKQTERQINNKQENNSKHT